MDKKVFAVINKYHPNFISYLSLSSDKSTCKTKFVAENCHGTWEHSKSMGYRVRLVILRFEIL